MDQTLRRVLRSLKFPLQFVALLWIVHLVQVLTFDFGGFGLFPRAVFGLRGIVLAPLIHADWQHLISNSAPLLFLGSIIVVFYRRVAWRSMLMIYLLTGLAVWLFGRTVYHIGASGVVYGLLSFVFWSGIFRRNIKSIVLALIVLFLYSGLFLGILPNQPGISWESHLLGALMGIFTAYWYKEEIEQGENDRYVPSWEREPEQETPYFLDRDVFDLTKLERREKAREEQERRLRDPFDGGNSSSTW